MTAFDLYTKGLRHLYSLIYGPIYRPYTVDDYINQTINIDNMLGLKGKEFKYNNDIVTVDRAYKNNRSLYFVFVYSVNTFSLLSALDIVEGSSSELMDEDYFVLPADMAFELVTSIDGKPFGVID